MGHLDSQRSLPTIKPDHLGLSATAKKLRLAPEHHVALLNAPDGYLALLQPGPADIRTELQPDASYDAVVLFVKDVAELRRLGSPAIRAAKPNGLLWITCPKADTGRAQGAGAQSKAVTDLPATSVWVQRDVLGEITSQTGLKAVSFVAIDDDWTALRFKRV